MCMWSYSHGGGGCGVAELCLSALEDHTKKNPKAIRLQGIQQHTLLHWSSTVTGTLKIRGKFWFVFCHLYRRKSISSACCMSL